MRATAWTPWIIVALLTPFLASAEVRVITTNPTLADLTRQIGGGQVSVQSLMRGPENPHDVIPKPSFVMKLRKADLFVHLGLDAEPWVPNLLRSTRQERLLPGGKSGVDVSAGIELLEIPSQGELTRALGDIHVYGNTHYALDPLNGIVIGHTLAKALARADPKNASGYETRAKKLEQDLTALASELSQAMMPLHGSRVVTYHRTWPYFLKRFQLEKLGEVEPKPGIAPGPRHITGLAESMQQNGVRLILLESFSNRRTAERLAELARGKAVMLAQEVSALPGIETYQALFRHNVEALLEAHRAATGERSP